MTTDIAQLLERLGIEGRERGDEIDAPCPMHKQRVGKEDSDPSWSINVTTGLHHCFSCGYGGPVQRLVSDVLGISPTEADKWIGQDRDLEAILSRRTGPSVNLPRPKPMREERLAEFVSPPQWALTKRALERASCEAFGVKWDPSKNAWILPIRDPSSLDLRGWQLKSEIERGFLNFPHGVRRDDTLFGIDVFPGGRMIVVESPLDAIRIHSIGIPGAVATFGSAVSTSQVMLMRMADEIVFAMDNPYTDKAGRIASMNILKMSMGVLRSVRFFDYQGIQAKDPGGMGEEEIRRGIAQAKSRAFGEAAIL